MKRLKNKIAVVTGGSRGIGRSIAMRLADEGAYVIIQYAKRKDEAYKVIKEIENNGGEGFALATDFQDTENVDSFFERLDKVLVSEKKVKTFDILVNNAGIGQILSFKETTPASLNLVLQMNVIAPFF
ncbi:NAD(P)-dependent dehydrogenase (short-subunit alcohol dehydrogenase family) [Enterococcus rivorum]|nr:SDR family NAD(P)-dependent oxidoreductase [Enterococcus rivorum]MBP2100614.1 NAD(P)-dependent dehydrogenase (short-subunit alcohol dehydrogenase family) [Enterococcus rivorum]